MIEEILPNVPLNFKTACIKDDGLRLVMKSKDTPNNLFCYKIDDYFYYTPIELTEDVTGTYNIFFQDKADNLLVATRMEIIELIENTDGTILFSGSINGEKGTAVFTKVDNDFVFGEGGSSGGSANLTTKEIQAQMIRNSVENGQAITPPDGVDGFSEITFPSYLLIEEEIVTNGTKEFGTSSAPYFPKKVIVNIPSDFTIEEKSFNKSSEPFTLDCSDKSFVYMMTVASNSVGQGIAGLVSDLVGDFTVNVSSAGSTAGTMTWTASTKKLTYTPNTNFQMGSTRFKLVTI